ETEARAKPESIGAEADMSLGEPKPFLRRDKALAQPPAVPIGYRRAEPNGHSQANVLRLVGAPNRLEERVQGLGDGPSQQPEETKAVEDLAEDMGVAAPCRELPSLSEEQSCLVLDIA